MKLIYRIGATSYRVAIHAAAFFVDFFDQNFFKKAHKRVLGAAQTNSSISPTPEGQSCYWMHCASVGEFEQGRPVWDLLRKSNENARFVVSFFSSSGFEQYTNDPKVGEVVYLPWDNKKATEHYLSSLKPTLALFVKYEWWLGYHQRLRETNVPYFIVSAAFRQNQPFFKWWGGAWKTALHGAKKVFVQNEDNLELLQANGFNNAVVTGDTRLDRVLEVASSTFNHPELEDWVRANSNQTIIVAGSTWPPDEELLLKSLAALPNHSLIIAPHEVGDEQIGRTLTRFEAFKPTLLSSYAASRVLIVDEIGLLSRLYRFGNIAYVGGGFGAGIHNTLEPLAYKLPIAFGPKFHRFIEAKALINSSIARCVKSPLAFVDYCTLLSKPETLKLVLAKAEKYCLDNAGSSQKINAYLQKEQVT